MSTAPDLTVSVVVVTYGRPDSVRECLEHLGRLRTPALEVVVVDASPDERTRTLVREEFPDVRLLHSTLGRGTTPESRQMGFAVTRGDVVAFVDDDAYVAPDWLDELLAPYADPDVVAVGGRADNGIPGEEAEGLDRIGRLLPDGRLTGYFAADPGRAVEVDHLLGANMSFRREALAAIGGIRGNYPGTCLCEESDISLRLRATGGRLVYTPRASCGTWRRRTASAASGSTAATCTTRGATTSSCSCGTSAGATRWCAATRARRCARSRATCGRCAAASAPPWPTGRRARSCGASPRRSSCPGPSRSSPVSPRASRPRPAPCAGTGSTGCRDRDAAPGARHHAGRPLLPPDGQRRADRRRRAEPRGAPGTPAARVLVARGTYPDRYASATVLEYPEAVARPADRYLDAALPRLGLPRLAARRVLGAATRTQDAWDPSWVLAHNAPALVPLVDARRHAPVLYCHNQVLRTYSAREAARTLAPAAAVVCVSDHLAEQVRDRLPRSLRGRVATVRNGVDVEAFALPRVPRTGRLRVAYVGRVIPDKGVHVLLDAVARRGRDDVEVTVVGRPGFARDAPLTPYEQELRTRAASSPAPVRFASFVDRDALPRLLAAADVLVVPSVWAEPFGLTALEGMAAGAAVVASDVGGLPEAVGDAGVLVPPGDTDALAAALAAFADDEGALERARAAAVRHARDHDWRAARRRLDAVLSGAPAATAGPLRSPDRAPGRSPAPAPPPVPDDPTTRP
ncbi:glycosyltransferase [Cellulosimicrobium sp. CUA-896]|uniref:glycosyltransferase n=1 Tax=Cellulosimicrobium sp. CUA-896 TaxID=1517881 RepID=UPI00095A35FB|nr:glycosyltransferase [Cellulosimicrobium sp. CUA-896]OLT55338.1 hypothetical protein BJF88_06895 [Cellulosimicrobium sp. CUA-896]